MPAAIDLTGQRFGRLTAIGRAGHRFEGRNQKTLWQCCCDCGNAKIVPTSSLRSGDSQSCGCLKPLAARAMNTKHGKSGTQEYAIWCGMIQRCTNIDAYGYGHYGRKQIKVCARWRHSFENFLEDMGSRPSRRHSIDRINNDGGYSPENCRWATQKEQQQNRGSKRDKSEHSSNVVGVTSLKLFASIQTLAKCLGGTVHV